MRRGTRVTAGSPHFNAGARTGYRSYARPAGNLQSLVAVGQTPDSHDDLRPVGNVGVVSSVLDYRTTDAFRWIHGPTAVDFQQRWSATAGQCHRNFVGSLSRQHQNYCRFGRRRCGSSRRVSGPHSFGITLGWAGIIAFRPVLELRRVVSCAHRACSGLRFPNVAATPSILPYLSSSGKLANARAMTP